MRILVMRYSSLGDVALTSPVLDRLDQAYPNAQIYYATKDRYAPAVEFHPAVTKVLELRGGGFWNFVKHLRHILAVKPTLVLDLHRSIRTSLITSLLWRARVLTYDKETIQRRLLVKKLSQEPSLHTIHKYLKVLEPLDIAIPSKVNFKVPISKGGQRFLRDFLQ